MTGIFSNFVYSSTLFVGAIITFIVCLPLFNHVIGMLPFGGFTVVFAGFLVVLLIVLIVYLFVRQNNDYVDRIRGGAY